MCKTPRDELVTYSRLAARFADFLSGSRNNIRILNLALSVGVLDIPDHLPESSSHRSASAVPHAQRPSPTKKILFGTHVTTGTPVIHPSRSNSQAKCMVQTVLIVSRTVSPVPQKPVSGPPTRSSAASSIIGSSISMSPLRSST